MQEKKIALVAGISGFIGHHIGRRLKQDGYFVRGVDINRYKYSADMSDFCDEFIHADLRDMSVVEKAISAVHLIIQLAADMGGCQYVFTGEHDADIMRNSAQINMNVLDAMVRLNPTAKVFYSSSACMYPQELQMVSLHNGLREIDAYPANPDSEYGWEKMFSERLYMAYNRNYGIDVRIARFHNIYGPEGTYKGGKEKAPASISRKVAESKGKVQVWGDGSQTRSFLYIDDCVDAVLRLIASDYKEPINIGSEESVTILDLWKIAIDVSGKDIVIEHVAMPDGFKGVNNRNSNNDLIREKLNWEPLYTLYRGMEETYHWIKNQIHEKIHS